MQHITLYRKYRPKNFEEVQGEKAIIKAIKNSLRENRLSHAYLFTGPRGIGKTTTARLIAKSINCIENGITDTPCNNCENCKAIDKGSFFDLIEIDAASNRGIDEIRELKDKINYKPAKGRKKVYIIDEVHMLTKEAFNALLKTLEEPPEHVMFILATTEPDKILDTIISRCQRYDFKPLNYADCKVALSNIAEKEDIKIDDESLKLIYEKSGGSVRDAISIFEKVISFFLGEEIVFEKTENALGLIPKKLIKDFFEMVLMNKTEEGIEFLEMLWSNGINIEEFFKDFSFFIKDLLIKKEEKMDTKRYIEIIETIYDVISKFKYEEDKRLLGYLILYKITAIKTLKKEIFLEEETSEYNLKTDGKMKMKEEEISLNKEHKITIQNVKSSWHNIINKCKEEKISLMAFLTVAFPDRIEGDKLYISFPEENKYHKNSVEKKGNYLIIKKVVSGILNYDFNIIFEVKGNKVKKENGTHLVKKMVDFFDGEIIEVK